MKGVEFPVVLLSGSFVIGLASEEIFEKLLSLSTDKAIRDGFYSEARLFDSSLQEFRIVRLALSKPGRWMRTARKLEELEIERVQHVVDFMDIRALVIKALREDGRVVEGIDRVASVAELIALL